MHRMMLKDEMLVLEAQRLIREERVNAEWAVKRATRKIKSAFHEQADEYFKERRADVDYVGERIIKNLLGQAPDVDEPPPEGAIIVAHDLSPADTALLLHERKVAGVRDRHRREDLAHRHRGARARGAGGGRGGADHHARGARRLDRGRRQPRRRRINPTPGERGEYEAARERFLEAEQVLLRTRDSPRARWTTSPSGSPATSSSSRRCRASSRTAARRSGSTGPSSSSSAATTCRARRSSTRATARVLEALAPRPVTIRTFDLGGDKLPAGMRARRKTRRSGCARSATASTSRSCSARSSERSSGRGARQPQDHVSDDLRMVPPTAQNQAAIEAELCELVEARRDLADAELTDLCERAIRNHDPCISCSAHFLDLHVERS